MKNIFKRCPYCGKVNVIKCTDEQYNEYISGDSNIQTIFPELSPADREILITGICGDCWNKYMKCE